MARVAIVLSGCGFLDGAEIHESVLCLLALAQADHSYHCFAPDIPQMQVVNHVTKEAVEGARNVMEEAARIARCDISPLDRLSAVGYDAVMLPGGFGVATNLSTYAKMQTECSVHPDLKRAVLEFHKAKKPILATCITPAVLAKIFEGVAEVELTLGSDPANAQQLQTMGMKGVIAKAHEMVADEVNLVYTTPCYMEPPDLAAMFEGVKKLVGKLEN